MFNTSDKCNHVIFTNKHISNEMLKEAMFIFFVCVCVCVHITLFSTWINCPPNFREQRFGVGYEVRGTSEFNHFNHTNFVFYTFGVGS